MISFNFKENCSGCGACYNICSTNAISMVENEDGFSFPQIDLQKCVNCNRCDIVCPHINADDLKKKSEQCIRSSWLYCSSDENAKKRSSSGAACYDLEKATILKGDIVCGCAWDNNLEAVHIILSDEKNLKRIQGSKYVQSSMGDCYKQILEQLRQGKKVLFSGTPCQATAVHNYIMAFENGKYRDRLITLAVICHGVASPLAWRTYKAWEEERQGSRMVKVNFRDKSRRGYKKSYCRYEYEDGSIKYCPTFLPGSKYIEATLVYNLAMRNSCTHCDCKGLNVGIDLIVGDWYAKYKGEGRLGTSCIVAFTERGKKYAEEALNSMKKFFYDTILKENKFIEYSIKPVEKRKEFLDKIRDYKYWEKVEELYPTKYKYKKLLVRVGLYSLLKKIVK